MNPIFILGYLLAFSGLFFEVEIVLYLYYFDQQYAYYLLEKIVMYLILVLSEFKVFIFSSFFQNSLCSTAGAGGGHQLSARIQVPHGKLHNNVLVGGTNPRTWDAHRRRWRGRACQSENMPRRHPLFLMPFK